MAIGDVLQRLAVMVSLLLAAGTTTIVGPSRLMAALRDPKWRLREVSPYAAVLLGMLLCRKVALEFDLTTRLSWTLNRLLDGIVETNISGMLFDLERGFIPAVQSIATPLLTEYFVFVYLYGYTFVLIFPFVAYFALEDMRPLKLLLIAATINYTVGLVLYVTIIAFGPRNFQLGESLLYTTYPQSQILTGEVNKNTNVFPSLHASLSITMALLSWRTRRAYPLWVPVSTILAVSVSIATMYLGIHWGTDVVAGALLAVGSVVAAEPLLERVQASERLPDGYG